MPEEQIQFASWPGARAVEGATYVCSHGIAPGVITLVVGHPPDAIALQGDFVFTDGNRTVTLRDCRVVGVRLVQDGTGQRWTVRIEDRRWRWGYGSLGGKYNQLDPRANKLVPWTIRSPTELAELCLKEMGEEGYSIDMPPGVDGKDYADKNDWFDLGQNTPPTGTNPEITLEGWDVPATVLDRLAQTFGRRVVFDPVGNCVLVAQPGVGGELPDRFLESRAVSVEAPKRPKYVGVIGAEVQFQTRLRLRAVGLEWHRGEYRPVDQLSYAPKRLTDKNRPWDWSAPGGHADITPTAHLNFDQAREYALSHIWRYYRIDDIDADPPPQAERQRPNVAGFGFVKDRWHLNLKSYRVERVKPVARDERQVTRATSLPPVWDYYDGHSRNLSAIVLGSAHTLVPGNWWVANREANTPDGERLDVGFTIDPDYQLVVFDRPVYYWFPFRHLFLDPQGRAFERVYRPAPLVLETAVTVLDDDTNEPIRYRRWREVRPDGSLGPIKDNTESFRDWPRGPEVAWFHHEDVAWNLVGKYEFRPAPAQTYENATSTAVEPWDEWYGGRHVLTDVVLEDESDAEKRADYYLDAHLLQFLLKGGKQNTYAGIVPVGLDGAVMQVEWSVGSQGPTTAACRNCEVNPYFAPYPARRWRENLELDPTLANQNLTDRTKRAQYLAAAGQPVFV